MSSRSQNVAAPAATYLLEEYDEKEGRWVSVPEAKVVDLRSETLRRIGDMHDRVSHAVFVQCSNVVPGAEKKYFRRHMALRDAFEFGYETKTQY